MSGMDVTGGRSGLLRVPGWMAGTGAGIWILLLLVESVAACSDDFGVNISCPLNALAGVDCVYTKGLLTGLPEPVGSIDCPGPVKDVSVDTVVKYDDQNICGTFLNITWHINPLANPRYLRGFLLNVTFFYDGDFRSIIRTYILSVADWNNMDIYQTAFRHECIRPASGIAYHVRIHSIPLSTLVETNYVDYFLTTSEEFADASPCIHPNNTDMTYTWRATMWSKQNPSEDTYSSLEICFFLAPAEFGFQSYKISLLNATATSWLTATVAERIVYSVGVEDRKACEKFSNVCPGIYTAWVKPNNDPWCVCRAAPNKDDCRECYATELSPINMTSSFCSSLPTTTVRLSMEPEAHLSMEPEALQSNDGKIIGIVVGIFAAILIVASIIILYIRCHNRGRVIQSYPSLESNEKELLVSQRKSVLLVYSTDNESHREVVRSFAKFLNSHCGCDVLYDEWSQVDIAQIGPIEWLSKQMFSVKHIIIVHSLGASEQYRGWLGQRRYVPESNLLLPDVFVPAVRKIQSRAYLGSPQFHCFHVCFPYTEQKHVLDLSFGQSYRLMDHIEDLFLNIHGLTKFSPKGTTFARQLNSATYYFNSKEGRALYDAIGKASLHAREHTDWFSRCYRQEVADLFQDHVCMYPLPGDDAKTSDLDNASDVEYVSPSAAGSYDGDVEIPHDSPDFGIGGMNYDSRLESSSPPASVRFSPSPPDALDDTSSFGSRSFVAIAEEFNMQYDSGFSPSIHELRRSRSDC